MAEQQHNLDGKTATLSSNDHSRLSIASQPELPGPSIDFSLRGNLQC